MNGTVAIAPVAHGQTNHMSARRLWGAYVTEAWYETRRMLRTPAFAVPFLGLPASLYLLFAVLIFGKQINGNAEAGRFVFAAFAVFGAMGPGLFGFGVAVATEREQGLLTLKRALPMPPAAYLTAKLFMTVLFALVVMATMIGAAQFARLRLTAWESFAVTVTLVLGALPFCAIGLFVGTRTTIRSALAIVNVLYQVMMHLSGLFYPLPAVLQRIAPIWPSYHLQQLVFTIVGVPGRGRPWIHAGVLLALTIVLTMTSVRRLARAG